MAFPQTVLPLQVELLLNSTWTDQTDYVYQRDAITITRGRSAEGEQVDPSSCKLTLNNRSGRFSPRNPLSPLYGQIGRNTPIRVSVLTGSVYLATSGDALSNTGVTTPDVAALDITGDMDVRFDATLTNWFGTTVELCGKGAQTGNQRSWLLTIASGRLRLEWSTAGVSTLQAFATAVLPMPSTRRLAVRATLDVNNGASGNTVTFYTAPTMAGPWTQLGNPVTTAGVTSVFNSTAVLRVGDGWSDLGFFSAAGAVHGFQLLNGIGGSVVANPDFTAQTPGATSFVDGTGKTWTVGNFTSITNRKTRFVGEVRAWPLKWDSSGQDVYVSIEAFGLLRRLSQGQRPLASTLRRRIPSATDLVAYWPMEDGKNSTQAYSPIRGVVPMSTRGLEFGAVDTLLGSSPLPSVQDPPGSTASFTALIPPYTPAASGTQVELAAFIETAPASLTTLLEVTATGTGRLYRIQIAPNNIQLHVFDSALNEIGTINSTAPNFFGQWIRLRLFIQQDGSNIDTTLQWTGVDDTVTFSPTTTFTGTVGRWTKISNTFAPALEGMSLGHLCVFSTAPNSTLQGADDGYQGETATARMTRISNEDRHLPISIIDDQQVPTEQMGPQGSTTILDVIETCADTDAGILYEDREALGLIYRTRNSLFNQVPVQLTYSTDLMPPLEPVDDDQFLHNDVTVTREGGSSGQATLDVGALSVQAPPAGMGPYPTTVTKSLYTDAQTEQHAGWLVHLGTVDEPRYPVVTLALHANPELIETVTPLDSGARLQILDPSPILPPGTIDLIVQGYTETMWQYVWDMRFNCTPATPYTIGVIGDGRADTEGSELLTAVSSSDTTLLVGTTAGERWIDSATYPTEFPVDALVGGEIVTVTAIAPAVADTFTRTVASGWGTATSGQAWTVVGTASDYAVNGTQGRQTNTTKNAARHSLILADGPDCDIKVGMAAIALSTGASQFACVLGRVTDINNHYLARLEFTTGGDLILSLRSRVAGTDVELAAKTLTTMTHVAARMYTCQLRVQGTVIRTRVWDSVTVFEGGSWDLAVVDTNLVTGDQIGLRSIVSAANTNTNAVLAFDNLTNPNPQRFTVTRGTNGVATSHAAGADIRLANPAIAAL